MLKPILKIQLFICLYPISSMTQNSTSDSSVPDQRIEQLANSLIDVSGIPGISIAVGHKGDLIYSQGFGYADIGNKIEMTPTTRLRTASVSKMITATALGKLANDGLIDFDDPISKFVPYAPEVFKELTIRQLAGHTSGVEHRGVKAKNKHYKSTKEIVGLFNQPKISFEANTSYQYSTAGYNLLAAVIEGASGKDYISYMENEIFKPLDMTHTYPENINSPHAEAAQLYYFKKTQLKKETKWNNGSYKLAGAGYRTTPSDLVKMTYAYYNGMLSDEVVGEMFSSNQLNDGTSTGVGIGWRNNRDILNRVTIDHAGGWQGARTVIVFYPHEQLSVSLMINAKCNMAIEESAHVIAQLFLDDYTSQSITPISIPIQTIVSRKNTETSKGSLTLDEKGDGLIKSSTSTESLKLMLVFKLPAAHSYCVVSKIGILFMNWSTVEESGMIHLYQSRNHKDLSLDKPLISLTSLQ